MDDIEYFFLKLFIGITLFAFIFNIILFYNTEFEKEITIKEKYVVNDRSNFKYYIISTDNKIYNIVDVWWKGEFNNADDYAQLNVGKTYRVKGYGIRVPFLSIHYKIYSVGM